MIEDILHYLSVDYLRRGAYITVWLALWGFVGGLLFGLVICALRSIQSRKNPLRWLGTAYVVVFRGTPFLLQLMIIYNALPSVGITLGPWMSAILGITLIEGAYIGETYRGGLANIPKGQRMAAEALGMSSMRAYWRIYLPQAFRSITPALANRGIAAIKETSVASVVAVQELTLRSHQLASVSLDFFPVFLAASIIYIVLTGVVQIFSTRLERRMSTTKVRRSRTSPLSIRIVQLIGRVFPSRRGGRSGDEPAPAVDTAADPAFVSVEDVTQYYGKTKILSSVSLDIARGEVLVIMGPSGSGKSTLLRVIDSIEPIRDGKVTVGGTVMQVGPTSAGSRFRRMGVHRRRESATAMVFQDFNLFSHMTLLENVMEGPMSVQGLSPKASRERALEALSSVGLEPYQDQLPEQLSGGQQQRGAIARSLAMSPELLLFDEPTSALDHDLVGEVLASIRRLAEFGMTMIIVTHERAFAREVADRVAVFGDGRIQQLGTPIEVLGAEAVA